VPGGDWTAPATLTTTNPPTRPAVGVDASGIATIVWAENSDPNAESSFSLNTYTVYAVRLSPSGALSPTQPIISATLTGSHAAVQQLALAGSGRAALDYVTYAAIPASREFVFRDSATGDFASPATVATSSFPRFAINDAGDAVVVYTSGSNAIVRRRAAGGVLGPDTPVTTGAAPGNVGVGVASDGTATVSWDIQSGDVRVMSCHVTTAGCTDAPQRLSAPLPSGTSLSGAQTTVTPGGGALVAWSEFKSSPAPVVRTAKAAFRAPGSAAFADAQVIAPPDAAIPFLSSDDAGDGVAMFNNNGAAGAPYIAAGFDAAPPRLVPFTVPSAGHPGDVLAFSAGVSDVWGPVGPIGWTFGDGSTATGPAVSHAFAAPGSFAVTASASDAAGNVGTATGAVAVADVTPPTFSSVSESRKSFRVGSKPTATSGAKKRRRAPVGTTIRYSLSEPAMVSFTIDRQRAGRQVSKVNKRCVAPTRKNRTHKACHRYIKTGILTRTAGQGKNSLAFSGRIGKKALAVGTYRLTLTAKDAAGNASQPRTLTFTIVR
jgi:hypothetical protein